MFPVSKSPSIAVVIGVLTKCLKPFGQSVLIKNASVSVKKLLLKEILPFCAGMIMLVLYECTSSINFSRDVMGKKKSRDARGGTLVGDQKNVTGKKKSRDAKKKYFFNFFFENRTSSSRTFQKHPYFRYSAIFFFFGKRGKTFFQFFP